MKYLLSLLLFIFINLCYAQSDHFLRIVSVQGDVTVDGAAITSGQLLYSPSERLVVENSGSYVYVLTPKGYVMKLLKGKHSISNVEDYVYRTRYKPKPNLTGAVSRGAPRPLSFVGIDGWQPTVLMNDSIYLRWKKAQYSGKIVNPPFNIHIVTLFDDSLFSKKVNENSIKENLRTIALDNIAVMLSINKNDCDPLVIKFVYKEEADKVESDLAGIKADQPLKQILDLIIYDSNSLIFDLMFKLDKISKMDTSALDTDLKNYISLIRKKYEFN